ncbi:tetratricopeptide repeat protein [Guptibacillus algicola]|uniref:tetratricopeptide repeat protein n=1 Tax=Guptibacillus algicola TaxID=225844 RepID=UPI001CD3C2B2|nr:DUF2628 domain-containing protein [Alkalihalobacillus algicola]MCA0988516.1 DUF2628 domain-containing protein [Alkalihalobacillus algicola]
MMGLFQKKEKDVKFNDLDEETREEVLEFAGKRAHVYEKKWSKLSNKKSPLSWNWATFFINLFWFAFRKMNGYAYSILGAIAVIDVVAIITLKQALPTSSVGPAFIVLTLLSNKIYFDFALKKVTKLQEQYPDREERLAVIRKRGGVSWWRAILLIVVFFIYSFSILFLEEKVYYSYMTPKFVEAVELQEDGQLDEALEIYKKIENDNIPVSSIHLNKMYIYVQKDEDEKALDEVNAYLEIEPEDQDMIEIKESILNKIEEEK